MKFPWRPSRAYSYSSSKSGETVLCVPRCCYPWHGATFNINPMDITKMLISNRKAIIQNLRTLNINFKKRIRQTGQKNIVFSDPRSRNIIFFYIFDFLTELINEKLDCWMLTALWDVGLWCLCCIWLCIQVCTFYLCVIEKIRERQK